MILDIILRVHMPVIRAWFSISINSRVGLIPTEIEAEADYQVGFGKVITRL